MKLTKTHLKQFIEEEINTISPSDLYLVEMFVSSSDEDLIRKCEEANGSMMANQCVDHLGNPIEIDLYEAKKDKSKARIPLLRTTTLEDFAKSYIHLIETNKDYIEKRFGPDSQKRMIENFNQLVRASDSYGMVPDVEKFIESGAFTPEAFQQMGITSFGNPEVHKKLAELYTQEIRNRQSARTKPTPKEKGAPEEFTTPLDQPGPLQSTYAGGPTKHRRPVTNIARADPKAAWAESIKARLHQLIKEELIKESLTQTDGKLLDVLERLLQGIESLDISVDYLSAAMTGETPLAIGIGQKNLGRARLPAKIKMAKENNSRDIKEYIAQVIDEELSKGFN